LPIGKWEKVPKGDEGSLVARCESPAFEE
jgi:hypothetical protein